MKYDSFRYLFPPRPEYIVPVNRLTYYEKKGYIAQYKKNGTCSIVAVNGGTGEVNMMNRHNAAHRAYHPDPAMIDGLRKLSQAAGPGWTVLAAEILHSKTPTIKNTLYIFDLVVLDGTYLVGQTFNERLATLKRLIPTTVEAYSHYHYTDKIWLAKPILRGLEATFRAITDPKIDEGLVLKRGSAKLEFCDKESANRGWQMKCRYQHKNYAM
jgi:hypothetical protein